MTSYLSAATSVTSSELILSIWKFWLRHRVFWQKRTNFRKKLCYSCLRSRKILSDEFVSSVFKVSLYINSYLLLWNRRRNTQRHTPEEINCISKCCLSASYYIQSDFSSGFYMSLIFMHQTIHRLLITVINVCFYNFNLWIYWSQKYLLPIVNLSRILIDWRPTGNLEAV